jgi:UDP-N-acetylglucosamine:LPS N-acetylglucosamine transferase
MGPLLDRAAGGGARVMSYRGRALLDLEYLLAGRFPPTRAASQLLLARIGRPGIERLIERTRPDVIVTTYPGVNGPLARLRRGGTLAAPVVSAITDLSSLHYWAMPGVDVHLLIHPESEAEVRGIAPDSRVVAVRGLSRPEFYDPPSRTTQRPTVVVSGGGWGVGDVLGAVEVARSVQGADVVVLCGRNDALRALVEERHGGEPRVRVLGFTDDLPQVLVDGDCLVHSSAGLTVLEAIMCGCRPISYGWGVAHIRLNNRAYRRFGLADVAGSKAELRTAIERALAAPREPDRSFAELPQAADEVLRSARPTGGTSAPGPAPSAGPPRSAP